MANGVPSDEMIAYRGRHFTIEWYVDESGHSQARDFAESLDDREQRKLVMLLTALGDLGQIRNKEKFRYEGDKICFQAPTAPLFGFLFSGQQSHYHKCLHQEAGQAANERERKSPQMNEGLRTACESESLL